jgi:hypothetical protein
MKTESVFVPDKIIQHVGKILDWSIMRGKGVQKEIVPECLWDQYRTLDERVVPYEEIVIPNSISG